MDEEKHSLLCTSNNDIDKQSKEPNPLIDEMPKKLHHESCQSSAPIRINVPINPSLETIGALCELETAETNSSNGSLDSDDENNMDGRPDYFPECLEDLIQLEHNYAGSFIYTSQREKNKQRTFDQECKNESCLNKVETQLSRVSNLMEEVTVVDISHPVRRSKRQIERQERDIIKRDPTACDTVHPDIKDLPNMKEQKNSVEQLTNLNSKIDDSKSESYCSNYKNFADFKKRHIKIVLEDCRNSKYLESSKASVQPSKESQTTICDFLSTESDSILKLDKESNSENSNDGLNEKNSVKTNLIKTQDFTDMDFNRPLLRKRKILKSETDKNIGPSIKCDKSNSAIDGHMKSLKPTFVEKTDESEDIQEDVSVAFKRPKRSSISSDKEALEKHANLPGNLRKRKKTVSFSDEPIQNKHDIPEKNQTLNDSKLSPQNSPPTMISPTTKSQKKKIVRRESFCLDVNENEPQLFSQPDVMVKVISDDATENEEKENEQNLFDPQICCTLNKGTNQFSDESTFDEDKSTAEQNTSNPFIIDQEPYVIPQSPKIKLNESNSEFCESTPETLMEDETICKDEVIFIDLKLGNNSTSVASESSKAASNNKQDMSINVVKQNSVVSTDERTSELNIKNTISTEVSTCAQLKPERKSLRIIKKKEFFEGAVDATENKKTAKSLDAKQNAEKENAADKSLTFRSRRRNVAKKEETNEDSDGNMDSDLDESEEDDPDKLWCICRKPHNARFMIQCDRCEDWFHGTCVGVTKAFGRQLEKLKKEWWCPNCRKSGQSLLQQGEVLSEIKKDSMEEKKDFELDCQHTLNLTIESIPRKKRDCATSPQKSDTKPKESAMKEENVHMKPKKFYATAEIDLQSRESVLKPRVSDATPMEIDIKPKESTVNPKVSDVKPREPVVNLREYDVNPKESDAKPKEYHVEPKEYHVEHESDVKPKESDLNLKESVVKPKESVVKSKESDVKPKESDVKPKESDVKPKESVFNLKESIVNFKESAMKPKESDVKARESDVFLKESEVKPSVSGIKPKEFGVKPKEPDIKPKEINIKPKESAVKQKELTTKAKDSVIELREPVVNPREYAVKTSESAIKPKESAIKLKECAIKPKEPKTLKIFNFKKIKDITQSDLEHMSKRAPKVIHARQVEKINKSLKLKPFDLVSQTQVDNLETRNCDHLKLHSSKKRSTLPTKSKTQLKFLKKKQYVSLSQAITPKKVSSKKNFLRNSSKQLGFPSSKIIDSKEKGTAVKKQSCVQCQSEAKVNSCFCSDNCIDKHVAQCLKSMGETKETLKNSDLDSKRLVVFDRLKGQVITNGPTTKDIASWLKSNPSFTIVFTPSTKKETVPQKKECDSSTSIEKKDGTDEFTKATVRLNVKKTLKNILTDRCKNADDIQVLEEDIQRIANKIEEELHSLFKDNSFKYRAKYRSLMFNIKDPRNQGLFRKILKGNIPPNRLVCMSSEELASMELAKWREQENQHLLDLIKREQLEHQKTGSGLQLKKTHKGEVEIEDDLTIIIEKDVPKVIPKDISEELVESEKEEEVKNTTHLHRSHLFDLNCKICTGKIVPPLVEETIPKKVRVAHSISVDHHSPNASDSVERTVSRIVEGKSPVSSTGEDSLDQVPTSTVSIGSPDISIKYSSKDFPSKSTTSIWKGFIFMQDTAKFVTSAYKVSGQTEILRVELPDTLQVCGRIIPDQVWDYLGKIKQSGNKELIVLHFQPANEEEAVAYHSFYSYLSSRKRYGVVSNFSKKIKDFYLLPLAATSPVPMVLVPFDGPGLSTPRPHLLLGVIIRHRFKPTPLATIIKQAPMKKLEVAKKGKSPSRSYTPPLPTSVEESPEQNTIDIADSPIEFKQNSKLEISHSVALKNYSECPNSSLTSKLLDSDVLSLVKDEDNPYDPEQDILSLTLDSKPIDIALETPTKGSDNLEQHKKILDALTRQVEETDRQVNALKQLISAPEEENSLQSPNVSTLDINSVAETGMSSFLDLPENLQEILNTVRLKSYDKAKNICEKGDVDMRVTDLFGQQFNQPTDDKIPSSSLKDLKPTEVNQFQSKEAYISEAETPPPSEENDKPSVACPSDPRIKLRTSFHPSYTANDPPKSMSTSEHARQVKQFMDEKKRGYPKFSQEPKSFGSFAAELSASNWNFTKEPPPPGVESSELSLKPPLNRNNYIQVISSNIVPTHYASNLIPSSPQQINTMVTRQTSSFPTHLPHGFSIHAPPPIIQHFPPMIAPSSFQPQHLHGSEITIEKPWAPAIQHSSYETKSGDWGNKMPQWDNSEEHRGTRQGEFRYHSVEKPNEFRNELFYKRGSINKIEEHGYTRGKWNVQHQRGNRFESQRRGTRFENQKRGSKSDFR